MFNLIEEHTMHSSRKPPSWSRAARAGLIAAGLLAAASVAVAGECPADKRVGERQGQKDAGHAAKGVTDTVITTLDVANEKSVMIQGRVFRGRRLDIAPGGIVPWHSHSDRPALLLISSGEITEYASTCAVPIVHKAGEITAEKAPTSHWWRNHGKAPVTIYAFDLFRTEDKANANMM
jgi:quercetin dioxygenase-like cupin family protein